MPTGLPNSKREPIDLLAAGVQSITEPPLRSSVPKKSRGLAVARTSRATKHQAGTPKEEEPAVRADRPSWLTSLVVHAVLLLGLSFVTLATVEREELALWASHVPDETIEEFPELTIDPSVDLATYETDVPSDLDDPGVASLGNLSGEAELADISAAGLLASADAGELGSLFGDKGRGLSDFGADSGAAMTSFFGAKSEAQRVVFVIDNTGSMSHGGFETVVAELLKTVAAMDPRQQFYVFFYSDQVYPLFFPQSQTTFVRATAESKQMLRAWLDSVELCTGGVWQLTQAMEAAYELRPQVIYLLSDGRDWDRVRAIHKVAAVERLKTELNPLGVPVHTLGMGCQEAVDRTNLESVAEANYGTFREVEVSREMERLAEQRKRPYHDWNSGPGSVWGTAVPAAGSWGKADQAPAE